MSADYLGPKEVRPHDTIWHVPLSTDPFGQATVGAATIEHLLAGSNPTGRDCIHIAWAATGSGSSARRLNSGLASSFVVTRGSMIHLRFLLKGNAIAAGWKPTIYISGTSVKYGGPQGYNTYDIVNSTMEGTFDWTEFNYSAIVNDDFIPTYIQIMAYSDGVKSGECWMTSVRITAQEPADTDRPAPQPSYQQPFSGLRGMQLTPNPTRTHLFDLGFDYKANLARFQFNTWSNDSPVLTDKTDMVQWDAWFASKVTKLQSAILWARQCGIKLTVSMMVLPGGATSQVNNQVPYNSVFMLKYLESWRTIATTCLGAPEVIAFDVMNEPGYAFGTIAQGPGHDFRSAQIQVIDAIREIDPTRWCIYEVNGFDEPNRFHHLKPIDRDNILYSVHMYKPTQLIDSSNTTIPYPGGIMTSGGFLDDGFVGFTSRAVDKDMLRQILEPVRRFQLAYQVPIYLGEFSICRWVPGAAAYLQDVSDIADEYGWMWTYHAFREANSWDVEYEALPANQGGGIPAVGITDRGAVLRSKFSVNEPPYSVDEQLPIAPSVSVTDTWTTDATLSWTPERCLIGSWVIEHRPVGGSWTEIAASPAQVSQVITGLTVDEVYEYRATLINPYGKAPSVIVSAPKGAAYLLDTISVQPAYAFSTRKLRAGDTNPILRVRRSSDNLEADIYSVGGSLDLESLLTFVGNGDGFVRTWYDRTVNARNLHQPTNARQPRIVASGIVDLVNAKPTLKLIAANSHWMSGAFAPLYAAGSATFAGVLRNDASLADSYLFGESSSSIFNPFYDLTSGSPQSGEVKLAIRDEAGVIFAGNGGSLQVQSFTNGTMRAFRLVDTGSATRIASNTVAEAQDATYTRVGHTLNPNQTALGARLRQASADKFPSMSVGELLAFAGTLSDADEATILAHQSRWFGL